MTDLLPDDQNTRQATNQARSEAGNHAIRDSQPADPAINLRNTTLFDTIFLNRNGLRAGWRVALYVVIFSLFLAICQSAAGFLRGAVLIQRGGRLTPQILLVQELALATSAIAAALVMKAIEGRRFDEYGMPLRSAFQRDFWQGSLWGMAQISALMLLIYALGGYSFGLRAVYGQQLIRYAVLWAIFFIIVGIAEEFLFRGYLLFTLSSAVGFWPAAILMAVLFGGAHLQNPGESLAGAASVFLFGLFLSL